MSRASSSRLVELGAMLLGHPVADVRDPCLDIRVRLLRHALLHGDTDGPEKRVRHLEGVAARDVEAVEQPVSDQIEIRRRGRPRLALERAQLLQHLARVGVRLEDPSGGGDLRRSPPISRSSSAEAPEDTGDAPRIKPSSSDGGRAVQSPTWARKSPVGNMAAPVWRMCW